jgi:hypothetical protein
MKITLNTSMDSNDSPRHRLVINGKEDVVIQDLGECPEDAHIGRDLVDGSDIIKYIKMGYEAAKNGEDLEIETVQDPDCD